MFDIAFDIASDMNLKNFKKFCSSFDGSDNRMLSTNTWIFFQVTSFENEKSQASPLCPMLQQVTI